MLRFRFYSVAVCLSFLSSSNLFGQNKIPDVEDRYKSLETFSRVMFYVESMYFDEGKSQQDDLIDNSIKGMMDKLDPHSMYLPQKAFQQFTVDTRGKFGGIGVIVSQERDKLIVVSPIEDTPAARAGILSGDEIIEIDDKKIESIKNTDVMNLMSGRPGTVCKLKIRRPNVKGTLDFTLRREIIKIKSVRRIALDNNVQYIRIVSFQEDTADQFSEELLKAKNNTSALIIDLRDNPGGLLDRAIQIADLFIDSGIIVSTVGRNKARIEREFANKRGTLGNIPIIVLVNNGSASASEIVAGALQDHHRALVIGTQTFGKGSVQTLLSLPNGAGLKLTVARYFTPSGKSIHGVGIKPDITKDFRPSEKDMSLPMAQKLKSDAQLKTAIAYIDQWKKISPGGSKDGKAIKVPNNLQTLKL